MSTLLLDKNLRGSDNSEARTLARARTLTVLSRLDPEDKRSVLQFLYESGLILRDEGTGTAVDEPSALIGDCTPYVLLRGADLSGASLSGASLSDTNLREADLRDADLRETIPFPGGQYAPSHARSILYGADLRRADLRKAHLSSTDLCSANLKGSELSGVDLSGVTLLGAKGVTIDRLVKEAESLDGAMMPNMRMCEELPACKGHGEDGENTGPP